MRQPTFFYAVLRRLGRHSSACARHPYILRTSDLHPSAPYPGIERCPKPSRANGKNGIALPVSTWSSSGHRGHRGHAAHGISGSCPVSCPWARGRTSCLRRQDLGWHRRARGRGGGLGNKVSKGDTLKTSCPWARGVDAAFGRAFCPPDFVAFVGEWADITRNLVIFRITVVPVGAWADGSEERSSLENASPPRRAWHAPFPDFWERSFRHTGVGGCGEYEPDSPHGR